MWCEHATPFLPSPNQRLLQPECWQYLAHTVPNRRLLWPNSNSQQPAMHARGYIPASDSCGVRVRGGRGMGGMGVVVHRAAHHYSQQ